MHRISTVFCYIFVCLYHIHGEILYQCNFDNATLEDHCFTTPVSVSSGLPILTGQLPDSPWSDVTSSLKPTNNGEVCRLPYKIDPYNWDLYFCYKRVCPTNTSANSTCASGKFAGVQLFSGETKSFQLKTESDGINGINEQYLVYYYYMSNIAGKSISVRKEEVNGVNDEVIDLVTSSPFNGWIKREVKYNATMRGYKLYFDVQKTSSVSSLIDIGLDEISISQDDEFTTESPTTSPLTDTSTSTLASTLQTSQMLSTTVETSTISSTDKVEQSTITTSIFQPLTTSTAPTTVSEIKTTTSSTLSTMDITTLNTETTSIITTTTTSSSETTRLTTTDVDSTYFETSSTTTTLAPTTITDSSSTTTMPSVTSAGTTEISTDVTTLIDTNKDKPSKKTYIIILSTVIPTVVVIVSIGIAIKIKRSSSRSSSKEKSRLYIDKKDSELSTDSFELELSNPDSHF